MSNFRQAKGIKMTFVQLMKSIIPDRTSRVFSSVVTKGAIVGQMEPLCSKPNKYYDTGRKTKNILFWKQNQITSGHFSPLPGELDAAAPLSDGAAARVSFVVGALLPEEKHGGGRCCSTPTTTPLPGDQRREIDPSN